MLFFSKESDRERERERWRTHADDDDAGRLDAVDAVGRLAPVEAHVVRVHVRNAQTTAVALQNDAQTHTHTHTNGLRIIGQAISEKASVGSRSFGR